jgi:hypothetical protein
MSDSKKIHILAEGAAEKQYAENYLRPYLADFGKIISVSCVSTSKTQKGGISSYTKAKNEIGIFLKKAEFDLITTMFDLFKLPNDFPNYATAQQIADPYLKVASLEEAFKKDINHYRFLPYLQLHEFEALTLANPDNLLIEYLGREQEIDELKKILANYNGNSELINGGATTAPSKRILKLIPEYSKVNPGVTILSFSEIPTLKNKCPHFGEWLTKLETL